MTANVGRRTFLARRDGLRSPLRESWPVSHIVIGEVDEGTHPVTFTLTRPCDASVGSLFTVRNSPASLNGNYPVHERPDPLTIVFKIPEGATPGVVATGGIGVTARPSVVWPHLSEGGDAHIESLLRFDSRTATEEALAEYLSNERIGFDIEPWDYRTVRVNWSIPDDVVDSLVLSEKSRVVLVRSGTGIPTTINSGVRLMDELLYEYREPIVRNSPTTGTSVEVSSQFMPGGERVRTLSDGSTIYDYEVAPAFNRPDTRLGYYDRPLPSGRWYYYGLFVLAFYEDGADEGEWFRIASGKALVPNDYEHRQHLYMMLPPWYRERDLEFTEDTNDPIGAVRRFLFTVGWELDYARTLAELGPGSIYDTARISTDLLTALGEQNYGMPREGGLGDGGYRSLISGVNKALAVRGTASGVNWISSLAGKYNVTTKAGENLLPLADDSEFIEGTGSWGFAYANRGRWFGHRIDTDSALTFMDLSPAQANQEGTTFGASDQKLSITTDGAAFLTCGAGVGYTTGRYHNQVPSEFFPKDRAVRCRAGTRYTFSVYLHSIEGGIDSVSVGIIWFRDPEDYENQGASLAKAYIANTIRTYDAEDLEGGSRLWVRSTGPRFEPVLYGVPFILVKAVAEGTGTVSFRNAMYTRALNEAEDEAFTADSGSDFYNLIVLGDEEFTLGSTAHRLGERR
jgi:hypothetical protein